MKRREKLLKAIDDQEKWMKSCGGDLGGYIEKYGDPNKSPMVDGRPKTFITSSDKVSMFLEASFQQVIGKENEFYSKMYGLGGTKIYEADFQYLKRLESELFSLPKR
jgi:hypothetical protein